MINFNLRNTSPATQHWVLNDKVHRAINSGFSTLLDSQFTNHFLLTLCCSKIKAGIKAIEKDKIQYFLQLSCYFLMNSIIIYCHVEMWQAGLLLLLNESAEIRTHKARKRHTNIHLEREKGGGRGEEPWKEEKIKIVPDQKEEVKIKDGRCEKGSVGGEKAWRGRKIEVIRKLMSAERTDVQALRSLHFSPVPFFSHLLQVVNAISQNALVLLIK